MERYFFYGAVVFCLVSFFFIDQSLALFLKEHVSENLSSFFRHVTEFGQAGYVWGLSISAGAVFLGLYVLNLTHIRWAGSVWGRTLVVGVVFRTLSWLTQGGQVFSVRMLRTVAFVMASQLVATLVVRVLKFMAGRVRPRELFEDHLYGFFPFSGADSFPSGHTQVIAAFLLPLAIGWPRLRIPVFFAIGLVALSRVVLTAHFLSDVVASIAITSLCVLWVRSRFQAQGWMPSQPVRGHVPGGSGR